MGADVLDGPEAVGDDRREGWRAAARAAGMASVAVTWGAGTREVLESLDPDAIVDTVDELREFLLRG